MRIKPKRIKVFPNPWGVHPSSAARGQAGQHCTIVEGRPCGLCMSDPDEGGEPGRIVGAFPDATIVKEVRRGEIRNNRQRTAYVFLGESNDELEPFDLASRLALREPVELTLTPYYSERIRDGSLIAADLATAGAVGSASYFVDPAELFPRLAREAARLFNQHFDADQDGYLMLLEERRAARGLPPLTPPAAAAVLPVAVSPTMPSPAPSSVAPKSQRVATATAQTTQENDR